MDVLLTFNERSVKFVCERLQTFTGCIFYSSLESSWQDLSNDTSYDGVLDW
jgi:hypothetical protein